MIAPNIDSGYLREAVDTFTDLIAAVVLDEHGVPEMIAVKRNTIACPAPGVYPDEYTMDEYHKIDAFNASTGKKFMKSGLHGAAYLNQKQGPPSNEMLFGTACHARLFEPDDYAERAITAKGTGGKELADGCAWSTHKKAQDKHPGTIILHTGWAERIERIHDAIMKHPDASVLVSDPAAMREVTLIWHMPMPIAGRTMMIPCKARLDLFNPGVQCIPDLKVTGNIEPREFERQAHNMGWLISGGLYTSGCLALGLMKPDDLGRPPPAPYPIIAVERDPIAEGSDIHLATIHAAPVSHLEQCYSDLIELGMRRYLKYRLLGIAEEPAWMPNTNPTGLPTWAQREEAPIHTFGAPS